MYKANVLQQQFAAMTAMHAPEAKHEEAVLERVEVLSTICQLMPKAKSTAKVQP